MTTWNTQANELFLNALELSSAAARQAYLDAACVGDAAMRAEVESLLQANARAGGFLESPASASELTLTVDEPPIREHPGTVIGPYKLLEQIGEGGFGIVFMAEQMRPIRRKVALKILKPGMDTRQVVARFEAERQALALMDHPHIAHVFDGGQTDSDRPYFVMELVKGISITDFCDQNQLSIRERLELFVSVCQAVQHAHQKGIIHRDLKPSNVLVTLHDGTPVTKVIDFGIAKASGQQLTDKTLFTNFAQMIGTPLYMSPEQAGMSGLDVDTRSDIYSLGVLLYELLTGTTPFDRERLKEVDYEELRRIIREEEPPRPSRRLSTQGQATTIISTQRQSDPKRLSHLFRGELDWVAMKALEKDRNRRYESASAFAADVRRYLSDEPVLACPPSSAYRLRKFVRRNKRGLAMAALVLFFVVSMLGGASWVVRDRTAQRARAANDLELALERADLLQEQGKRAEALAALERAQTLLDEAAPDAAPRARLAALQERLDAQERDQEFVAQFEDIRLRVQSELNVEKNIFSNEAAFPAIRDALRRYGIALGDKTPAQAAALVRGRSEPVRRNLIAALDECFRWAPWNDSRTRQWLLAVVDAADTDAWRAQARKAVFRRDGKALEQLVRAVDARTQPPSFLLYVAGALPEPSKSIRLELLRRIQRAYPADLWTNYRLAQELHLYKNGQPAESVRYYTAALALRPDNPGIYLNRGQVLKHAGEMDAAIADYRQALALAPRFVQAHNSLGDALHAKGQLDEAIAEFRQAIRVKKDTPNVHFNLGNALRDKGQLDEAITEYREAIRFKKDDAATHTNLGNVLKKKGRLEEAIAEYREAIRIKKDYPETHNNLGFALLKKGRLEEAIAAFRLAIRIKQDFPEAHYGLGLALSFKDRPEEAIAELREAIRLNKDYAEAQHSLGATLYHSGRVEEAIAEYREVIRIKNDSSAAHYDLGAALAHKGQVEEAIAEFRAAIRLNKDDPEAHKDLGALLRKQGKFRESLEELRRGHELGSKDPGWRHPSAQWVREGQRLVELDERLPSILEGKTRPANAAERIELAKLCYLKRVHRATVRFFEEAFAEEPRLADEPNNGNRYDAACAAALAACGQGKDVANLDDKERIRLRGRALEWLRADLEAWSRLLDRKTDKTRSAAKVAEKMQHWLTDTDFAGVRGAAALVNLPEGERKAWQELWKDVAVLLELSQGKTVPKKK